MTPLDVVIATIIAAAIIAGGISATVVSFIAAPLAERRLELDQYSVRVPGTTATMNTEPLFDSSPEDIGRLLRILEATLRPRYPDARKRLVDLRIHWVQADEALWSTGAHRHIRRAETGEIVAGWQTGRHVFVVYRGDDTVDRTAFAHEVIHRVTDDRDHKDETLWGAKGLEGAALRAFRGSK